MQGDEALKQQVLAAATADDVAQIALKLGFEFKSQSCHNLFGPTLVGLRHPLERTCSAPEGLVGFPVGTQSLKVILDRFG